MQRSVFVMDAALEAWREGPDLPAPRAEFVCAHLAGRVVVTGGRAPRGDRNRRYRDHGDVVETLALDANASRWIAVAPAPTARNSAAGAVLEGRLHVVGGRALEPAGLQNLAAHEVYDPLADRWGVRAPMPQAQGGLAAAALNRRLYAFGGEVLSPRPGVFSEVWEYDLDADAWRGMPAMPVPRHGLGAVTLGDAIYVTGGATNPGAQGRSDRHEVFRPGD